MILQRCAHSRPCYDDGKCHYKGECGHKAPLTKADRIRAMSDEELAILLTDHSNNGGWVTETGRKVCYERIIEWLQQPAGEEDKHETD